VDAVDDRVGGVVSIRERKEISCRKAQHGGRGGVCPDQGGLRVWARETEGPRGRPFFMIRNRPAKNKNPKEVAIGKDYCAVINSNGVVLVLELVNGTKRLGVEVRLYSAESGNLRQQPLHDSFVLSSGIKRYKIHSTRYHHEVQS
jgi:hypothetical protein